MWQKPWFDIYSDPGIFEDYAAAMTEAGLPELAYNFDKGREDDMPLHGDLLELFSDKYREVHSTGPFGAPYQEVRNSDGTISMKFAWMNGIDLTAGPSDVREPPMMTGPPGGLGLAGPSAEKVLRMWERVPQRRSRRHD